MQINIYYGGRGLIDDPTLFTLKRITEVLEELNVRVEKYDLFEQKNNIITLPRTLKEADGIILATTVEWHGVGGHMASFLDACWLYGDKEKIAKTYMAPVVMSTTYGEKEAELDLANAWQSLGGQVCAGISGYIPEESVLENNKEYQKLIEKSAENIYRCVKQQTQRLPASVMAIKNITYRTKNTTLTQQETEQLSEYASDDKYVAKQKQDISELAMLFKGKMSGKNEPGADQLVMLFRKAYQPQAGVTLKYKINIKDQSKPLAVRIDGGKLEIAYGEMVYPDAELTMDRETLQEITEGRKTFQGGFMEGSILSKGNFGILRQLDTLFPFMEE